LQLLHLLSLDAALRHVKYMAPLTARTGVGKTRNWDGKDEELGWEKRNWDGKEEELGFR
jgi:hypothetical protein